MIGRRAYKRHNRGRITRRYAYTPLDIDPSNLVLWLPANLGVTRDSASVSNDTLATWTPGNLTSRVDNGDGTMTMTDDAVNGSHTISNAPTNLQAGPCFGDFTVKQGTIRYVRLALGTGVSIFVDLQTATTGTAAGGATATLLSGTGGQLQTWRVYGTYASGNIVVNMSPDGVAITYVGGTGTVIAGTGATYGPVLTQDRVSARADQSGRGYDATQAADASQPILQCRDAADLWVPYGTPGAVCEIGWPLDATKVLNYPAGLTAHFTGEDKPETLIAIVRRMTTLAATGTGMVRHLGAGPVYDLGQINTSEQWRSSTTDGVPTTKSPGTIAAPTSLHSLVMICDGQALNVYVDGVGDVGNPLDLDVGTRTLTASTYNARARMDRDIAAWKSALSLADARRAENGMRVRARLAPL